MADAAETHVFFEGEWHTGDRPIIGARAHAIWLGSSVFDGARYFDGVAPDLDLHCRRLNRSAEALLLKPTVGADEHKVPGTHVEAGANTSPKCCVAVPTSRRTHSPAHIVTCSQMVP